MEPREKTYFEQQREALIGEIAMVRLPIKRPLQLWPDLRGADRPKTKYIDKAAN